MAVTINASNSAGVGITSDTSGVIQFQTNGANTVTIDAAGDVGIGTAAPGTLLHLYNATASQVLAQGDSTTSFIANRASTDVTAPIFVARKARGTIASQTAVASGDNIGNFSFQVYGGANFRTVAQIRSFVETYTSDTDISAYIAFNTSSSGSVSAVERMRIDPSGSVLVTGTGTGALGYGTGSGGTVTQGAGSGKATTVTLNKPTGVITMNNAALAAGATVFFILNNSALTAADILLVQPAGGTVGTEYQAWCSYIQAGSAYIALRNNSGGSLSQAVTITFSIIRAATA